MVLSQKLLHSHGAVSAARFLSSKGDSPPRLRAQSQARQAEASTISIFVGGRHSFTMIGHSGRE